MKYSNFVLFILLMSLLACSKENELEGIEPENPYDVEIADYASLDNIRMDSCNSFKADVQLKSKNLPQGIDFSHVIVENRNSMEKRITNRFTDVSLETSCNQEVDFYIYLYDIESERQTPPSVYTLTP